MGTQKPGFLHHTSLQPTENGKKPGYEGFG